jgi:hypothetical protein
MRMIWTRQTDEKNVQKFLSEYMKGRDHLEDQKWWWWWW